VTAWELVCVKRTGDFVHKPTAILQHADVEAHSDQKARKVFLRVWPIEELLMDEKCEVLQLLHP
jgi:hypothetical protein